MKVSEVSKRYAKALLESAKQNKTQEKVYTELQTVIKAVFVDSTVKTFFANPLISTEQKVAAIEASLRGAGLSEEVYNTIILLGKNDRLAVLDEVALAYQELLDVENGVTRGVVKSAQPLSTEARAQIEKKIEGVLNKKIVLTYEQDPKLLGGVVAQVGGWTFDDSIDTHLKKLNEELNRRAN